MHAAICNSGALGEHHTSCTVLQTGPIPEQQGFELCHGALHCGAIGNFFGR